MFLQTGKCQMNHTDTFVSEGPQSEGNNMPIYDNPTVHNRENSFNNHLLRAQWAAASVSAQQLSHFTNVPNLRKHTCKFFIPSTLNTVGVVILYYVASCHNINISVRTRRVFSH